MTAVVECVRYRAAWEEGQWLPKATTFCPA